MSHQKVIIDVSDAFSHRGRRFQGIHRLVAETAAELASRSGSQLVRFDPQLRRFREVSPQTLARRYELLSQGDSSSIKSRFLARLGLDWTDSTPSIKAQAHAQSFSSQGASLSHRVLRKLTLVSHSLKKPISHAAFAAIRWVPLAKPCLSRSWKQGEVLLQLGQWRSRSNELALRAVVRSAARCNVRTSRIFFDAIPALVPQYTGLDPGQAKSELLEVLRHTDLALPISQFTKMELERLSRDNGIDMPPSSVIRMASRIHLTPSTRPGTSDDLTSFVLCVGTIEIRKNHHLLFDVWEHFLDTLPIEDIPRLVIAGSIGWLNTETLCRLRYTPGFDKVVSFVESPTDSELAWLYRHCLFTVYPALYEGWGYPITESLDLGKVVVTSSVSSMPEAAKGLGILLDPRDRVAWRETIADLFTDRSTLREMEERIRTHHTIVTPSDVADDILNAIDRNFGPSRPQDSSTVDVLTT